MKCRLWLLMLMLLQLTPTFKQPTYHFIRFLYTPTSPAVSAAFLELGSPLSLSGLQRAGNDLLFWDNVKYNVPLHSWKTCPDSLIAVGNSRRQVYEHLPNRDVHQRWCCFTAERVEGNSLKTCGKTSTSYTAVSQTLTSAHWLQPDRFSIIFPSTCDKTSQCIWGDAGRKRAEGKLVRCSCWKGPNTYSRSLKWLSWTPSSSPWWKWQ